MHTLILIIDRFERGKAILKTEDGQELVLSRKQLPRKIKEGSVLTCEIYRSEDAAKRRQDIARYLLEEVLNSHGKQEES